MYFTCKANGYFCIVILWWLLFYLNYDSITVITRNPASLYITKYGITYPNVQYTYIANAPMSKNIMYDVYIDQQYIIINKIDIYKIFNNINKSTNGKYLYDIHENYDISRSRIIGFAYVLNYEELDKIRHLVYVSKVKQITELKGHTSTVVHNSEYSKSGYKEPVYWTD